MNGGNKKSGRKLPLVFAGSLLVGCAGEKPPEPITGDWGDDVAYPELGGAYAQALTALAGTCDFTAGAMTIDGGTNVQTIIVGVRAVDQAILVNGATCGTPAATVKALKTLAITATTGAQTVILDYLNGLFGKGSGTTAATTVDLGVGTDALLIRGTSGADDMKFASTGIYIDKGTVLDVTASNVETYEVSLAAGADVFTGSDFATLLTIHGGTGNDTLTGTTLNDIINGGEGNDSITGGDGDDALNGDAGDDTFLEGTADSGSDTFNGGAGTADMVSYAARTVAVTATIGAGTTNDGVSGEADDILASVEGVTGGSANDSLTGDANANVLTGGGGNDTLVGLAGADTLNGGDGDDIFDEGSAANDGDTFNGGAGTDTVNYGSRTAALTVTMDGVTANDGESGEADNVKADVENIIGGTAADTITGNNLDNVITGGLGNDVLTGGAGNDTFAEGAVTSGADVFNGGTGVDTVDYSSRTAALTVTMDGDVANDGLSGEGDDVNADVENLRGGTAADNITGNALANDIDGGAGADTISGGAGDDVLYGAADADTLNGDAGDDLLDGGLGDDTLNCGEGDDIGIGGGGTDTIDATCEL